MPRDASGNYTLAPGNPVISGTTIESTWANTTMDDLAISMTDSLDRNGRGGMLSPLFFVDGIQAAPGISWANEQTTGWFRAAASDTQFSLIGQLVLRIFNNKLFLRIAGNWVEFMTSLIQDTFPILGGVLDLGGFGLGSGQTAAAVTTYAAGEVGFRDSGGVIKKTDATSDATSNGELFMALAEVLPDEVGAFMEWGLVTGLTGLTAGDIYYLDPAVIGGITNTVPSTTGDQLRVIGYARSTTSLAFKPSGTWLEIA